MSIKLAVDLLDLSAERDQWERLALDWARSAFRAGYDLGRRYGLRHGYRLGYADASRDWWAARWAGAGDNLSAQADRRRYPPGGRRSWLLSPACPPAARMTPYKLFRHLGIPAGGGWHQPPAGWREMDAGALVILHDLLHESGDGITIAHTHARSGENGVPQS